MQSNHRRFLRFVERALSFPTLGTKTKTCQGWGTHGLDGLGTHDSDLEYFRFCYKLPCPILSVFFCGKGGIPKTTLVYTSIENTPVTKSAYLVEDETR
jgi:hypothetical protein